MPYCTKCGAKIDENALFCTSCGEKQAKIYYPAPGAENNGYTKPEQTAPTYGGYTQSYDPTLYSAPAAGAYATQPAKKKNSGGKIAIIILAALLVIGLLVFAATKLLPTGGSDVDESLLGVYSVQKAKAYGIEVDATTLWEKGFDIELKKNGRCLVNVDGNKGSGKWTLDGSDFSLKASDLELNGSLYDGIIRIDNAMDMGVTLYFTKDGATLPSTSLPVTVEPAATPAPESPEAGNETGEGTQDDFDRSILGKYYADRGEYSGVVIAISTMWKDGFSIDLLDGWVCDVEVNGLKGSGTWALDGSNITVEFDNLTLNGTINNGVIKFDDVTVDGMTLYFTKDGSMKPEETPEPAETQSTESAETGAAAAATETETGLLGVYYADKAVYLGVNVNISDMWEHGFTIELLADGKCSIVVNQTEGTGTWTVDGDKISVMTDGLELSGVIEDGMLKFENVILDGMTLYFTKQ